MKKILFFLMFVCSAVVSMAQLRLNEIYRISDTSNKTLNRQFFELALAPTQTASVNSDSYALLAYYNTGSDSGFYVLDLPSKTISSDQDISISPGDYLVSSSAGSGTTTFTYQNTESSTVDYKWVNPLGSASTKQFSYNGSTGTYTQLTTGSLDSIFTFSAVYPRRLSVFLYRKHATSDSMILTDAFIASESGIKAAIPTEIGTFAKLTFPLKQAGQSMVNAKITFNANSFKKYSPWGVTLASPNDEGYFFCSSWDKLIAKPSNPQVPNSPMVTPKMTPRALNTTTQGQPLMAMTSCEENDDFISVTVSSGMVAPYPIEAYLYLDVNHNQELDDPNQPGGDILRSQIIIYNKAEEYFMEKQVGDIDFIIVLDAAATCYDDIIPFMCSGNIVTPVTLASFNAQRVGSNVQLNWKTASETNNSGYYLQRRNSSNAPWQPVTFISSKAAGGNSNMALSYNFTDANPSKGITQYRLLQIDNDGKGHYSEVRSVRGLEQANKTLVYPNPTSTGTVNVVFEDATSLRNIEVIDMMGRVMKQWKGVSTNSMQITGLNSGLFNIRIYNTKTGQQTIEKILVATK